VIKKQIPETINHRIKRVRTILGMTQTNFSRVISLSSGYLAGIETERRAVNGRLIKLICSYFKINEQWLRSGEGSMFDQTGDEMFIKLTNLFKELKPQYRAYIFKEINLLLEMQDKGD
jgi:transcriptional regulator with XRE-family HTH domain